MPNLFRTVDDRVWKPGEPVSLSTSDGTRIEGVWTGSATNEKRDWWCRKPGSELTQSDEIAAVATKDEKTGELLWLDAPPEARLFFVLEGQEPGKNYRRALMVTVASTPAQQAYLNHHRFSLFGKFQPDGSLQVIPPLDPPPPRPPKQGELF